MNAQLVQNEQTERWKLTISNSSWSDFVFFRAFTRAVKVSGVWHGKLLMEFLMDNPKCQWAEFGHKVSYLIENKTERRRRGGRRGTTHRSFRIQGLHGPPQERMVMYQTSAHSPTRTDIDLIFENGPAILVESQSQEEVMKRATAILGRKESNKLLLNAITFTPPANKRPKTCARIRCTLKTAS